MVNELPFQGHVYWDTAVPANIGYIASKCGTKTTVLPREVQ